MASDKFPFMMETTERVDPQEGQGIPVMVLIGQGIVDDWVVAENN